MDPRQFDTLAKTLATPGTRRSALAALLSGALGLLGRSHPAQARKRRGGGGVTIEGPCGDGSGRDNACRRPEQCCTGICERTQPGKPKRCRCRRKGQECTETRNCCQAAGQVLVCDAGTCQPSPCDPACGECERCVRGACDPDPGQQGTCCAGGTGVCAGSVCEPCANDQACDGGICTCTSDSCPTGCCEGTTCHINEDTACGTLGGACTNCVDLDQVCGGGGTPGGCGCETDAEACAGQCGPVINNCSQSVNCGCCPDFTPCQGHSQCCSGFCCFTNSFPNEESVCLPCEDGNPCTLNSCNVEEPTVGGCRAVQIC